MMIIIIVVKLQAKKIDCVFPWRLFMDGLVRLMDSGSSMGFGFFAPFNCCVLAVVCEISEMNE
jgi:hypothetical protein